MGTKSPSWVPVDKSGDRRRALSSPGTHVEAQSWACLVSTSVRVRRPRRRRPKTPTQR
jgi:hypothetical protein